MNQRVPSLISAFAISDGTNLIARFGQYGTYGYGIVRASITGPRCVVSFYRTYISEGTKFTTVQSEGIADAQFTPVESIPPGVDVIVVWHGAGAYTGTATCNITTDGGGQ